MGRDTGLDVSSESKSSNVGKALKQLVHPREYGESHKSQSRYLPKVIKTSSTRPKDVQALVSLHCQAAHKGNRGCLFLTEGELL